MTLSWLPPTAPEPPALPPPLPPDPPPLSGHPHCLQAKGNAAFSAGNFPEAVEHFTAAIAVDGSNHVLYSNRSAARASQGEYAAALEDARKTVELKADW